MGTVLPAVIVTGRVADTVQVFPPYVSDMVLTAPLAAPVFWKVMVPTKVEPVMTAEVAEI